MLSPTKDQQEILKDIRAQKPITYIVSFNATNKTLAVGRIIVNGGVVCENLKSNFILVISTYLHLTRI